MPRRSTLSEKSKQSVLKRYTEDIRALTIHDALAAFQRYDTACSLRVGFEKLQGIAQDAANNHQTMLEHTEHFTQQENELTSTKATIDTLKTQLVTLARNMGNGESRLVADLIAKLKSAKNETARNSRLRKSKGSCRPISDHPKHRQDCRKLNTAAIAQPLAVATSDLPDPVAPAK